MRVAAAAERGRLAKNHPVIIRGSTITARYCVNETNWPIVMAPSTTRMPPTTSTDTVPSAGMISNSGRWIARSLAMSIDES